MRAYPLNLDNRHEYRNILHRIGVDPHAVTGLCNKAAFLNIYVKDVKASWANIIKQEMISVGGDAAINMNCYACKVEKTDILLMGSFSVIAEFISKMKKQPECFNAFCAELETLFEDICCKKTEFNLGGNLYDLQKDIICIGILNVTPDSFSDGGHFLSYDLAMKHAEKLCSDGADIVDVGGESTRPGSNRVSVEEEMERVIPVIKGLRGIGIKVSIDSYKPEVVKEALKHGAVLVNDVNNGNTVVACSDDILKNDASVLVMQNLGADGVTGTVSENDLQDPLDTFLGFRDNIYRQLCGKGIDKSRIMYDPGIGFGLSTKDISRMLKNVSSITALKIPLCIGISRKSYFGRALQIDLQQRDSIGNSVSLMLMQQGVRIFRTHDPKGLCAVKRFFRELADV